MDKFDFDRRNNNLKLANKIMDYLEDCHISEWEEGFLEDIQQQL